jgi:aspartyl-tRNA(Asn)/glutamyl-tRNA(Gln) amidotransferase subunit B
VDLGLPGVLPVLNVEVVNKAITFGLAVDAHINQRNVFDRKNYFYPECARVMPMVFTLSSIPMSIFPSPTIGKSNCEI